MRRRRRTTDKARVRAVMEEEERGQEGEIAPDKLLPNRIQSK